MGIFARLRERSAVIKFLVNAQKTVWYPILFGILCFVGGVNDYTVYIPIMWVLISMHLFSVLFTDDNKVFLTPLCMTYFALGQDTPSDAFYASNGEMLSFMHEDALKHIIAMGIIGVGALIIRLILDGSVTAALKKRRAFTWGIVAMDIAFILNGFLSPTHLPADIGYGALFAMGFTVVYILVAGMLEHSNDFGKYACYVMVFLAYSTLFQAMSVIWRLYSEGKYVFDLYSGTLVIDRSLITLGWGVSNVITGIFILGIPAAIYLAKNSRAGCFYFFSCPIFVLGAVLVNTRSAMLAGAVSLVIFVILGCISGKKRVHVGIYTAVLLLLICAAAVFIKTSDIPIDKIIDGLRLDVNADNGRFELWQNGIKDFKSSPVFGAGFSDGGYDESLANNNVYSNMYHCILVQLPGAMGIIGCIAFIIHAAEAAILAFKHPSTDRFLMLGVPFMIILMSLFDNFFFYLHFQILYGVFCAVAEKTLSSKADDAPNVL